MSSAQQLTTGLYHNEGNIVTTGGHYIDRLRADDAVLYNPPAAIPATNQTDALNLHGADDVGFMQGICDEIGHLYWPLVRYYRLRRDRTEVDQLYRKAIEFVWDLSATMFNMFVERDTGDDRNKHTERGGTDKAEKVKAWVPEKQLNDAGIEPDKGDKFIWGNSDYVVTGVEFPKEMEFLATGKYLYRVLYAERARGGYYKKDITVTSLDRQT